MSALLRSAGVLQVRAGGELAVSLEQIDAATARMLWGMARSAGCDGDILSYREPRFQRRSLVSLRLHGQRSLQLMHEVGVLSSALAPLEEPPRRVVARSCCRGAYLRGVLAATGSVSAPHAPGHLELRLADLDAARWLAGLAAAEGLHLSAVERRGHAVAYTKSKQVIRELLVLAGAHDAALSFEEAEVMSATREHANRLTNCDAANLARLGAASRAQLNAITKLDLGDLAPELRDVAELRLRHPDLSLAELGRRARPPLPKSTVARRLRALTA